MKTYWDTWEGSYQMGEQKHRLYLLDLLKKKKITSLLDVGCGTGPIWEIIKNHRDKYNFAYLGTDYSPAMIGVCREAFPDTAWKIEDARHLNESDGAWDCVLLLHSLDHLDDYKAAIKEAARVAGRYVCIVLWRPLMDGNENNLNNKNMYGKREGEDPWEDTYLQEYSKKRLEEAFQEAHLKVIHRADGEALNSDQSHYNFLFLLEK